LSSIGLLFDLQHQPAFSTVSDNLFLQDISASMVKNIYRSHQNESYIEANPLKPTYDLKSTYDLK